MTNNSGYEWREIVRRARAMFPQLSNRRAVQEYLIYKFWSSILDDK